MPERDPYSLLLHDDFMGEFIDDDHAPATFGSLDDARWGALALAEALHVEQTTLGESKEDIPYTIYVVGPDGSRTRSAEL